MLSRNQQNVLVLGAGIIERQYLASFPNHELSLSQNKVLHWKYFESITVVKGISSGRPNRSKNARALEKPSPAARCILTGPNLGAVCVATDRSSRPRVSSFAAGPRVRGRQPLRLLRWFSGLHRKGCAAASASAPPSMAPAFDRWAPAPLTTLPPCPSSF
jgi:hypothetical protein